jgi:hypothetical protein
VSACHAEKALVVRDVIRRKPLGKLVSAGSVLALISQDDTRVVATGRGRLERFDVRTAKREQLLPFDPYTLDARALGNHRMLIATTRTVEIVKLGGQATTEKSVDCVGRRIASLGDERALVASHDASRNLTLTRVDLAKGTAAPTATWPLEIWSLIAMASWSEVPLIPLSDGTLARADPKTLKPSGTLSAPRAAGPGVMLPDGKTWLVARYADKAVLDMFDLPSARSRGSFVVPGARNVISAIAYSPGGRVVVGDASGWVVSIEASVIVGGR